MGQNTLNDYKDSSKKDKLDLIKKDIKNNLVCDLKDNATNLVFGKGNIDSDIFFIGEAPGKNEDLEGLPFVGRAGKQLDDMLSTINLGINDVYIANILKYRPPKNRDPNPEEIKKHTPYLIRQIKVIKPKVVVTLGNFATKFALAGFKKEGMSKVSGISKIHGTVFDSHDLVAKLKIFPMYHPAAMLYRRKLKDTLYEDFEKLGKLIKNN
ncbi:MAG: uracil-DNA glycosylase [Candidatus Woesearchaeota archaeon]